MTEQDVEQIIKAMTRAPDPACEVITIERAAAESMLRHLEDTNALPEHVAFLRSQLAEPKVELWAVHSVGPGEVYPSLSKEHAEREAQELVDLGRKIKAERIERGECVEHWHEWVINVIPSPWEPAEHFELLAEETSEHRDDLLKQIANASAAPEQDAVDPETWWVDTPDGDAALVSRVSTEPPVAYCDARTLDILKSGAAFSIGVTPATSSQRSEHDIHPLYTHADQAEVERLRNEIARLEAANNALRANAEYGIRERDFLAAEVSGLSTTIATETQATEHYRQQLADAQALLLRIDRHYTDGLSIFGECEEARALLSATTQLAPQCDHQWTDDGQHLLICTSCGAQEDHDPKWRDMATAPRDGTMLRLLVAFTEHATEDADEAPTIGANNFDNDGEDRWQFAGWCWSHDHFTEGKGEPIGWLPMLDDPRRTTADGVKSDE